ncbi:MAG TPA: DNA adenine methylase [Paraburkholderia sp.]
MSTATVIPIAPAAPPPSVRLEPLRAPFPWFGGKSRVAPLVWDRFGADVKNYVEPFAGSLAVLLARPHAPGVETVNDLDCYVANFWRALQADSGALAEWCDGPINETDLHARHLWLVNRAEFRERMKTEPEYFDVKIAGWWVWGICQWIGSGWCSQTQRTGRTHGSQREREIPDHVERVKRTHPHLTSAQGVHAPGRPRRKIPNIADGGQRGVLQPSRQLPSIGHDGNGINSARRPLDEEYGLDLWLWQLARRLTRVRVCCGDWRRILTPAPTTQIGTTAVFLDPPYAVDDRDDVYGEESRGLAHDVREWAIANGNNPDLRICLAGYEDEHAMPPEWKAVAWKANGGYANQRDGETRGRANALRETLWFSPACLEPQGRLF